MLYYKEGEKSHRPLCEQERKAYMLDDYKAALRSGQRAYRACVAKGEPPFLEVLDEKYNDGLSLVSLF